MVGVTSALAMLIASLHPENCSFAPLQEDKTTKREERRHCTRRSPGGPSQPHHGIIP
jgi:hypothetical protein